MTLRALLKSERSDVKLARRLSSLGLPAHRMLIYRWRRGTEVSTSWRALLKTVGVEA